jgi:hypothetical protein
MPPSSPLARFHLGASVALALALALGCGGSDLVLPGASQPAAIAIVKGNGQSGVAGGILLDPLTVRITDATNRPVVQIRVAFKVLDASGGRTQPDTAVTDNDGRAAALWVLGTQSGSHQAQANVVGATQLAADFTATVTAGAPAGFQLLSGDGQRAPAGTTLAAPLVVKATDAQGNPVAGLAVAWSATGGGTVNPAASSTGPDGTASTQRTLGSTAGEQSTVANAGDIPGSPVTFAATATTGSAGQLSITTQPSATAVVGQVLAQQPQIQLRDNLGNAVAQAGVAVIVKIANGPAGGTIGGQLTQATNASGLASFTDLSLGGAVGTFTLGFEGAPGANLAGVTSAPVAVNSGAPSASRSTVVAAPGTVPLGATSTVTVTVRDALGNVMGGVNVVPAADDPAGSFTPQQATTGLDGVATFSFSATKVRTYAISVQAGGIAITQTAAVQVTKIPTTTTITSDNPDPSVIGQPVTVSFTVTAAGGSPTGNVTVTDGQVSCSAALTAGQCQLAPVTAGPRIFTASYPGNDTFAASSGTASHQVTLIPTVTTIIADDPDPSFPTQEVTVQFTVTAVPGAPGGTVTVSDGSVSCSGSVGSGKCTLTPTSSGNKTLTATYPGQSPFAGSVGIAPHQVVLALTTTALSSSPNPSLLNQAVVFTAQVSSTFKVPNAGTVLFGDGGSCPAPADTLGNKGVNSSGVAALSKKNLTVGTHNIIACYLGTTTFAASASAVLVQQVTSNK